MLIQDQTVIPATRVQNTFVSGPIADCYDVFKVNGNLPGIYTLQPDSEHQFQAYCLEYGWTAIQSRGQYGNPKDFFLKNWDEYVAGFGEPG